MAIDELPDMGGGGGINVEAIPVVLIDQNGSLLSTRDQNGAMMLMVAGGASEGQAATIIQQNATMIANQQTIITLLQGGINVNVLGNGL